jgi:hypothetical protein
MENQKEIWKIVEAYFDYEVSNFGNVKSLQRETYSNGKFRYTQKQKILKPCINTGGYYIVNLFKNSKSKTFQVHQLVAMAFLNHKLCGHKLVVNHINFNKLDNRLTNLEIISQRENCNKKHIKSSSKHTGVTWNKNAKKWKSHIVINGKQKYLGYFINEIDAYNAYQNELLTIK